LDENNANQSLIASKKCVFVLVDKRFYNLALKGVYKTEICLAQMGVDMCICWATSQSCNISIELNTLKIMSSNTHIYVKLIISRFCQLLILFQKASERWNLPMFKSYIVYCYLQEHMSISKKCKIILMSLMRSLYKRHDYMIYLETMLCTNLCRNIFILGYCVFLLRAVFDNYVDNNLRFTIFNEKSFNKNHKNSMQHEISNNVINNMKCTLKYDIGGGKKSAFTYEFLHQYTTPVSNMQYNANSSFTFLSHCPKSTALELCKQNHNYIFACIPLSILLPLLPQSDIQNISKLHNLNLPYRTKLSQMTDLLTNHHCSYCETYASVFDNLSIQSKSKANRLFYMKQKSKPQNERKIYEQEHKIINQNLDTIFPPAPPSYHLQEHIIRDCCKDCSPKNILESGCAVCGQLTPCKHLSKLSTTKCNLQILSTNGCGITRKERTTNLAPIEELSGPVLDSTCSNICVSCENSLLKKQTPKYALAKGLWLGTIPSQLQNLTFAEQLLIARVRHNKCIVRVSSGMHKMKANAIMFENPIPKIYRALPPPIEELDDVLAFIFTGPCKPTDKDMKRTPLLVRRRKVCNALEWLKLNHVDYYDLDISYDNLQQYPENDCPVVVAYRHAETNKNAESTSAFDQDYEDGTEDGPCPFVVNGITGEELEFNNPKALIARATKHLIEDNGGVLAIGHSKTAQSIYHNPKLYPMMFPHLFPYGLGGIGSTDSKIVKMSEIMHKRRLLMYHDKRFQCDPYFPLVAFNHEQIKKSTTGGYLLTQRNNFDKIAERLMNINIGVLSDLSERLSKGERVKPETDAEKNCYQVISDLDHVAGNVHGSITSKKYMRNEIWSLISYLGAPSWFITFAPADNKHPICLYYANTKERMYPQLYTSKECYNLIANNPVAGARFFHFMTEMFIKHVLGVGTNHAGLYGDTAGYYGTVEQQGRLTLHLHLLLWIIGSLTPQEIRDKVMDVNSDFQKKLVEYLESLCVGQFLTGTKSEVSDNVTAASKDDNYVDPTYTLPDMPPYCSRCKGQCNFQHVEQSNWWEKFKTCVDDILLRSNIHSHKIDQNGKDKSYCLNANGQCKRRFPRETFEQTLVEPKTGALNLKKGEPWMNTITPVLTYLLRSNSDVTSLLSGTAIKAVVAYVTDYITKQSLKTYTIFDVIKSIFDKNSEMLGGNLKRKEKVRKLFTQIVNSLTAKLEIGGPMASLYVLGNPDHYTNYEFIPFYWKPYVKWVTDGFEDISYKNDDIDNISDKVVITKINGSLIGLSQITDYIFRPTIYEHVNLYDWIRFAKKERIKRSTTKRDQDVEHDNDIDLMNDSDDNYIGDNAKRQRNKVKKIKYSFQPDHPQYETHNVYMLQDTLPRIPNFIPNTLPRPDHGDRESYCCTMLTFFKPWRTCTDLKKKIDSWDKAFSAQLFTNQQLKIIKHMNVRYECLDARDDYSTKQKMGMKDNIHYQWLTSEMVSDLDEHHNDPIHNGDDFNVDTHYTADEDDYLSIPGKKYLDKLNAMATVERTMKASGWLDNCNDGLPDVGSLHAIQPSVVQSGKQWNIAVHEKRQAIIEEKNQHLPTNEAKNIYKSIHPNEVKIVNKAYLFNSYQCTNPVDSNLIKSSIKTFNLNADQIRAFHIVANHATSNNTDNLHMYLGGMAGTGKSQVIKALMHFFNQRRENHRFLILAPTGAAAALVNGSTYHSVLGINEGNYSSEKNLAQIRANLEGVDYIFLDEVSMLSCRDLYKISCQCANARGEYNKPFGGINFVFAGDFAQLPPAMGAPSLYSGTIGTQINSSQTVENQEASIGKALWHQVTTVVILRENMRQKIQSYEDAKLRKALENMRYKACTSEDIVFLRSRIAGRGPNDPKLAQKRFRNVSVITAFNIQKDKINELGCKRFAAENNQTLTSFYSIDKWKDTEPKRKRKGVPPKRPINPARNGNVLTPGLQKLLWELPHSSSDKHIPGKLSLCIGMPVMLRHNDATECCITKGAEATVVSWQSIKGTNGQNVLDTLFVKLKNPPKSIQIDGLPENVVPITRHITSTTCTLPNDETISISRDQALVLPNFAMTDYASQGRTRPDNPVDLSNCKNHQSYYTCLSRSASAAGTIIIQGFNANKIVGGACGYLRQEFRELELLDEITKLQYNKLLPEHIYSTQRNVTIQQFQAWKGTTYIPKNIHPAIHWKHSDFMFMKNAVISPWQIIKNTKAKKEAFKPSKSNLLNFVAAQGSIPITVNSTAIQNNNKRKQSTRLEVTIFCKTKKQKVDHNTSDAQMQSNIQFNNKKHALEPSEQTDNPNPNKKFKSNNTYNTIIKPCGLRWDGDNYSCAYDALFTILFSIWNKNPQYWGIKFQDINNILNLLTKVFYKANIQATTLETARDTVRHSLYQKYPHYFPYGQHGTSISDLANFLFKPNKTLASSFIKCVDCNNETNIMNSEMSYVIHCPYTFIGTTSKYFSEVLLHQQLHRCTLCNGRTNKITKFHNSPPVLILAMNNNTKLEISKNMSLLISTEITNYELKGIIYLGDFHFTCHLITSDYNIWFHDGRITGRTCYEKGHLSDFNNSDLLTCDGNKAVLVIYTEKLLEHHTTG
jgi:hypothetical protein